MNHKPAVCLGFFLNTLDEEFDLSFEHVTLVGRLRQPVADWPIQRFVVIVSAYLDQQLHLPTNQTTTHCTVLTFTES